MTANDNFNSVEYWNSRYKNKNNSGDGSYGRLAEFKADVLGNCIHLWWSNSSTSGFTSKTHEIFQTGVS